MNLSPRAHIETSFNIEHARPSVLLKLVGRICELIQFIQGMHILKDDA